MSHSEQAMSDADGGGRKYASELEEGREVQEGDERTPLDRTIDRIGMGASCRVAHCL